MGPGVAYDGIQLLSTSHCLLQCNAVSCTVDFNSTKDFWNARTTAKKHNYSVVFSECPVNRAFFQRSSRQRLASEDDFSTWAPESDFGAHDMDVQMRSGRMTRMQGFVDSLPWHE
eukprot:4442494-Amphidinium_carterae.1